MQLNASIAGPARRPQPAVVRGRAALGALIAGCLCVATLVLFAARLLSPPARLVDLGAAGDAYVATSFYGPERAGDDTFRWSGPNSALALPAHAERTMLSMRLHGAKEGQQLSLAADRPLGSWPTTGGWRVYRLLAHGAEPRNAVQLYADMVRPGADDPRELGVAIDWVHLAPLPGGQEALPRAAAEAAKLVWGLALLGAALWLAERALAATHPVGLGAAPALLSPIVAALLAWAWVDLDSMRWLLPLAPGPLAAATVGLAALWAFAQLAAGRGPEAGRTARAGAAAAGSGALEAAPAARWRLPHFGPLPGLALVVGPALLLLWSPAPMAARGAAALVVLWAPGWLLMSLLLPQERDRAMGLVLRVCGSLAVQVVLLLGLAPLLAAGGGPLVLLACVLTSVVCAALLGRRGRPARGRQPVRGRRAALWGLILLVAAALRLPALGGAELHDDEASVLLAAAALVQGDAGVLLAQLKGPAQILLPAGPLALTGQLSELTARLPFAVAGLAAVLGAMALARRLLGPGAGPVVAGLVLALDGLLIAFARIVQYQSLVMALSIGAYWCCWRFARGAPGAWRYLTAAALLMAVALLGHYDAIYVLPALLWLVVAGVRRRRWGPAQTGRALAGPLLLGAGLLASFYVPFALHPHAAETLGHLSERTGQGGGGWALVNNLGSSYALLTVYSAAPQVWAVALLALGLVAATVLRAAIRARRTVAVAMTAAVVALLLGGCTLAAGQAEVAIFALAAGALAVAALAPATPAGVRPLLIWFGAGWLSMTFLVAQPRTHIYVAVVPAALLAAAAARGLGRLRLAPAMRGGLAALAVAAILMAGLRQHVVFVRQSPEYIRAYPAARLGPWAGDELALDPAARFGFPGRDGWKAIGELYARGELSGAVASNQSSEVLAWYLRGQRRCGAEPAVYLIALSAPNPAIPQGFTRTTAIQADGRDQLLVYQRPGAPARPRAIALEPYVGPFDERHIPPIASGADACR